LRTIRTIRILRAITQRSVMKVNVKKSHNYVYGAFRPLHWMNEMLMAEQAENRRLQAFEREATELKHTVEGLKQENASMKAIKDQIAALTGTFGNTSSTPVPSTTTGIKSEVKKEYIKKEQSEGRPIPSSNGKDRPAKRPRTFVELD